MNCAQVEYLREACSGEPIRIRRVFFGGSIIPSLSKYVGVAVVCILLLRLKNIRAQLAVLPVKILEKQKGGHFSAAALVSVLNTNSHVEN